VSLQWPPKDFLVLRVVDLDACLADPNGAHYADYVSAPRAQLMWLAIGEILEAMIEEAADPCPATCSCGWAAMRAWATGMA
jgi:hypothetical protein